MATSKNASAVEWLDTPKGCIYRYRVVGEEHWRCSHPAILGRHEEGTLRDTKYKTGKWCDDEAVFPDKCPVSQNGRAEYYANYNYKSGS